MSVSYLAFLKLTVYVSVVAVHGLDGGSVESWTDPTSGACWLQEERFLPMEIPNARIMTFDYNSRTVAKQISVATIRQHADTLIGKVWHLRRRTQVSSSFGIRDGVADTWTVRGTSNDISSP